MPTSSLMYTQTGLASPGCSRHTLQDKEGHHRLAAGVWDAPWEPHSHPRGPPQASSTQPGGLPLAPGLRLSAGGQAALPPPDKPWGTVSCAQGQQGASWGCDLGFYLKPSSRRVTDPTSARSSSGHKPTK